MKCDRDTTDGKLPTLMAAVLSVGTLLLGCQPAPPDAGGPETDAVLVPSASEAEATAVPRLALAPGDVLEMKFFHTPEINETQMVRPDGRIALQLVGEIKVQGMSPSELREDLMKRYAPHLKQSEIVVIVRSLQNRRVFVGGEVMTPGIVQMPGTLSLLEAVMQAGGFDMRQAEVRNVVVIRNRDGQRYAFSVNLAPALKGEAAPQFFLEARDIVYVPRTEIAKLGQWIDQHINKIIPDTGIIFTRTSGRTTVGVGSYR